MQTFRLRWLLPVMALVCMVSLLWFEQAQAAGEVGDGTPASCDGNALAAALVDGGLVTFNCGQAPVTIVSNTNVINAATPTVIDGAGKVTLDGEDNRQLFIVTTGSSLTLKNLTATRAAGFDGAVARVASGAMLVVENSVLTKNGQDVDRAGAIYNEGSTTIDRTDISYNEADVAGGAIVNEGILIIRDSFLHNNEAMRPAGNAADGGAIYNAGILTIERSTLGWNRAERNGGGLFLLEGTSTLTNVTIRENTADKGGGIFTADTATTTILNATIERNNADTAGNLWNQGAAISIQNTIIANAFVKADNGVPSLNCDGPSVNSLGNNLIGDGSCVDGMETTDQRGVDPMLDGIDDNGGFAPTVIPLEGSPALDRGDDSACPAVDQRGMSRPQGDHCDIGAVEVYVLDHADTVHTVMLPIVQRAGAGQ